MKYNLPRPGYPATPQQQRDMLQTVGLLNNPVLQSVGYNTVSVTQNGIETRDYTPERILGKITGHGTGNIYSFSQVIQTDETGTVAVLDGGVTGTTSNFSAFEMNGRTDVPTNTIVELVPTWGAIQGYGFVYNGIDTSSGTLADAAVHVTATSGGTYTVKRVNRDSGGTLVESSPTVTYTGVYEAQGRAAVVDPTSTPTHELPLFIDKNGKYYFQIDQYADGNAATPLVGIVSNTTQYFKGQKLFKNDVRVNYDQDVFTFSFGSQSASSAFTVYSGNTYGDVLPLRVYDGDVVIGTEPTTKSSYVIAGATNLTVNGQVLCADYLSITISNLDNAETTEISLTPLRDTINTWSGLKLNAAGKYGGATLNLVGTNAGDVAVFPSNGSEYYTASAGDGPGAKGETWSGTYSDVIGGADFQVWPDSKTISTDFQIYLPTTGQSIATEAKPFQVTKVTIGGTDYWMVHVVP